MDSIPAADAALIRRLDGEARLLREAILMVADGSANRVMVAGLRLAGSLMDDAARLATEQGVRLVPQWTADEQQLDLVVERMTP
jgi:hypothetical protein